MGEVIGPPQPPFIILPFIIPSFASPPFLNISGRVAIGSPHPPRILEARLVRLFVERLFRFVPLYFLLLEEVKREKSF
jgi:hypothetical protein